MPHKPAKQKVMPKKYQDFGVEFLQISLPQEVKATLSTAYGWTAEELFEQLYRLGEQGIKVSFSWNEKNLASICAFTFTQRKGEPDERKVSFSSFGPSASEALRVALAKHVAIFDGDPEKWADKSELTDLYG